MTRIIEVESIERPDTKIVRKALDELANDLKNANGLTIDVINYMTAIRKVLSCMDSRLRDMYPGVD